MELLGGFEPPTSSLPKQGSYFHSINCALIIALSALSP